MIGRLTRDAEPLYKGDEPGALDEIVLDNASVHLERMDRRTWMLIVRSDDAHFHLTIRDVVEYEMSVKGSLGRMRQLGRREEWQS